MLGELKLGLGDRGCPVLQLKDVCLRDLSLWTLMKRTVGVLQLESENEEAAARSNAVPKLTTFMFELYDRDCHLYIG